MVGMAVGRLVTGLVALTGRIVMFSRTNSYDVLLAVQCPCIGQSSTLFTYEMPIL